MVGTISSILPRLLMVIFISSLTLMFSSLSVVVNGFLRSTVIDVSSIIIRRQGSIPIRIKLGANASRSSATELSKLANELGVSKEKVRELLIGQRRRLIGTEAKAKHIDWLLHGTPDQTKLPIYKAEATSQPPARDITIQDSPTFLTNIQFAERSDLNPATRRALSETLGLTSMTEIQAKTYAAALSGKDVLGRARTGTGKTIAFLLPSIERILRNPTHARGAAACAGIGVLVISPTRELATQIGVEAEKLLTYHKHMSVQVVFGGTKVDRDISRMKKQLPTILVATPGRLKDLLQTATVNGTKLSTIMSTLSVVVLDETDQLLDLGFRREIQDIMKYLPRNHNRQTLLFSATIPHDLKEIMSQTMKKGFVEVDCIQDGNYGEESTQTHAHVQQSHVIIPSIGQYVSSVVRIVREAVRDGYGGNKIVVFFPTARMVSFFAEVFNHVVQLPVLELHSRKTQGYRNRISEEFRVATSAVLLTSDVSARGVDYPGVTHVIQFGIPSSKEQYIHRLGRTGRAGAEGKGWLVLHSFESSFLEELKRIHIPMNNALVDVMNNANLDETGDEMAELLLAKVERGDKILVDSGEGAYQAFLGYYLGQMKRIKISDKDQLVKVANEFALAMGFKRAPVLGKTMVSKMGLTGVTGVCVQACSEKQGESSTPFPKENRGKRNKPRWINKGR